MAELRKLSEAGIKDEEESAIKRNIDNSDKIIIDGENEKMEIQNVGFNNTLKRYSLNDLLSLRNAQLSIHYPHCAIRPELQVLSIWTCRLRCELHYLGLWNPPNAGIPMGNGNCNGSCLSNACEFIPPFPFPNSQAYSGNSQMCYSNVPNSLQLHPMQSSSPTLGTKKAERSRERFLNYQRNINTELIGATSPNGEREGSSHYMNHHAKPAFIDHRSISSSHLMPAFAKRRMGHANALHGQLDAGSQYNTSGHNTEHLSNDGVMNENTNNCEAPVRPRKESVKSGNDPNDYHLYKASPKGRMVKSDRISSDYSPSNNKVSPGTVNKKLISERRIGSGRLIPREVSLEMRSSSKKRVEKEIPNTVPGSSEKDKDNLPRAMDKQTNRNSSIGRYSDPQIQEGRIFDRRISTSEDSNNGSSNNRNKKYIPANLEDERDNFESNYQQATHFTGKRSISFRRREYVDPKDHHREFRDFRERKESRDSRDNREQRDDEHHHHFYRRDNKEEPEWFSEGPTSQHETIELRGFEEIDDTQHQDEQSSENNIKIEKMSSNSSLQSLNSSSNINLSTKSNFNISNEMLNNSDNKNNTLNTNDMENNSNCNENTKDTNSKSMDRKEANELNAELQKILPKAEEYENSDKQRYNVTELFIDNFLNMEAIDNSLISGGNDPSSSLNEGGGTSRFSRWFFNNSNNVNSNDESNNNPPSKKEPKPNKDINESDFNSFMSFFKCNNYQTPELPKGLPSNVSALSVEELEARMRKMDSGEPEKSAIGDGSQNLHKNALSVEELEARMRKIESYEIENFVDGQNLRKHDYNQTKKIECPSKPETSPQTEANTEDVEAFRKLLDQLGKPPVDVSMNINYPGPPGQPLPIKPHVVGFPSGISQLPPSNPLPQINMPKQEFIMPNMHQQQQMIHRQQNINKMPIFQHQYPHSGMSQLQPENMPFMAVSHSAHTHHMPGMMIGQPQKRLDVQHLIQSVVRGELSRSFLEKELQNRNISPYNKEVITTVLKETSRFNIPESLGTSTNSEPSVAPNNLMQSLARGEVSLNFVEHELNKLNNINIVNDVSVSGAFKERSRCGTPLTTSLNVSSIPTSGSMIVPLPSQVVPRQEKSSVMTNETAAADQQHHHQNISSMYRSNFHDQHSQAMMQNALFKKKLEMEQQEALRRRQENFKQQKHEPDFINQLHQQQQSLISNPSITQQGHQQSSRQINNPTPLAFMPTSVLRKMTAEKEPNTSYSHATSTTSSSTQQIQQPHLQQPHLKIPTHPQMYQHSNQPRIILGRGNLQYMHQQQQQPQIPPTVNDSSQFLHNKNLNYAINGHF